MVESACYRSMDQFFSVIQRLKEVHFGKDDKNYFSGCLNTQTYYLCLRPDFLLSLFSLGLRKTEFQSLT